MEGFGFEQWKTWLEQWSLQAFQFAYQTPPNQLYAAIAVLLFTIFFLFFVRFFNRTKSRTIVLCGLGGSGKTVLFYQNGSSHQRTVTSTEPNEGTFVLHSEKTKNGKTKPVHLVDVPGHSHLRPKLDEFLPQAAGVVFVIDALEFLPNCRATSEKEYLYDVLTKASVVKKKIPVLILCNKTDKVTAHTKEFIQKQMEKEINKLKTSRSEIADGDIANEFTLGTPGGAFSFTQCQNRIAVAEASVLNVEISRVELFIREHIQP